MSRLVYDIAMVVGTAACSAGAGLNWGAGWGLIVGGAMVVTLTLVGALLAGSR
ncbi:MAG TPA: hypothetical protein PLL72_19295 [Burkholderiaceae bacterium]|nr:hypothetical protein [Burkholderiaceae bacterium]